MDTDQQILDCIAKYHPDAEIHQLRRIGSKLVVLASVPSLHDDCLRELSGGGYHTVIVADPNQANVPERGEGEQENE